MIFALLPRMSKTNTVFTDVKKNKSTHRPTLNVQTHAEFTQTPVIDT